MRKLSNSSSLVFSLVALILLVLVSIHHKTFPKYVDWKSFEIAGNYLEYGTFTNGGDHKNSLPGYNFAPGYPLLIAVVASLSPASLQEVRCLSQKRRNCERKQLVWLLISVQLLISILALILTFVMARALSNSDEISILTLLFFLFSGDLAKFSQSLLPFVYVALLTLASSYFFVLTYIKRSNLSALFAGIFSGLAALFYPPFALVPLFCAPALYLAARDRFAHAGYITLTFLLGTAFILTPWALRNYFYFGEFALTHDSSIMLLAKRVAYNAMSGRDELASMVLWLPTIGDPLANMLFPAEVIDRLGYGKTSYIANFPHIASASEIAGQPTRHYGSIISRYIWGDFHHYLRTIPTLFMRGFWGGSTIGLIGVFFLWPLQKRLRYSSDYKPFLLVFIALSSSVLAQALIAGTLNPQHFSGQIIFIHAYAIAHVTGGVEMPKFLRRT